MQTSTIGLNLKKKIDWNIICTSWYLSIDELSWRDGFGQALAVSGILISTLVVLGVFAWLLAPVFGYRLCTVLGNCEPSVVLAHSNNGGNLQDPGQANGYSDMYNSVVSPYMSAYRKR